MGIIRLLFRRNQVDSSVVLKNVRVKTFTKGCMLLISLGLLNFALAENRIDSQRPDAPQLAAYGEYKIGVRTLELVNPDQINILALDPKQSKPNEMPLYDRPLTAEVWYPAQASSTASASNTIINAYIRDGKKQVELHGKAIRDAKAIASEKAFPLVIVSHGYPGNRFLLAHLAENIASKGYVVVSIDHTDSTYRSKDAFASTLVNRPVDQLFVLDHLANMAADKSSFLYELVDANNTALIGYSMGGYGALINAGAGITKEAVSSPLSAPFGTLKRHQSGLKPKVDERLKTIVAFAPWGMNYNMFDLNTISIPMMLVSGSQDDVSGYENGVRAIWQGAKNVDRSLLTYMNANHNAGAVMPAPEESYVYNAELGGSVSAHYYDAVWDNVRMNNIAQHFVSAWLNKYLKNDDDMKPYLDLVPNSNDGVWAKDESGQEKDEHTYWQGFDNRTAKGLKFERLYKAQE